MIRLRALHRDTAGGRRNSSHAESPASDPGEEEPDTPGIVAAANRETETANVPVSPAAADTITPDTSSPTDDRTLDSEPANSGSDEPSNQETAPHQPDVRSNLGWYIEKFSLSRTVAVLGFVLAVVMGAATWAGMNYANYYARKSYELSLYQTCRSYEDIKNSTTCRNVLATGLIRIRSLPDVRAGAGAITAYLTGLFDDTLIGHLQKCENDVSGCLVRSSGPGVSYASFISSVPEMRVRLFFALLFRVVAIIYCRAAIFGSHPWTWSTPTSAVFTTPWITNIFCMGPFKLFDVVWVFETGALSGQIPWETIASWAFYFTTTAAFPIFMSMAPNSLHTRLLLLSASLVILAPLSPGLSDVEANIALAMTSMACYGLLLDHSRLPASLDAETLQEEGKSIDRLASRQILGTPPNSDYLEQRGATDRREEGSHKNEFPGSEPQRREAGDSHTGPETTDKAHPHKGDGAGVPARGAF